MKSKFKILRDKIVYDGKFIRVIKRYFLDRAGHKAVWEMVQRKTRGRIVSIVAITKENEIILEKCFRVPLKKYTIELPAGLMDKKGESEEDAIKRELLEETGYGVPKVRLLTAGPFNSGLTNDELAIYFGSGARKIAEPQQECSEDIEIIKIPVKNLFSFIKKTQKRRIKIDLKLTAILPFLK